MRFIFNPDAEDIIPNAEEEHRHSGERYGYSVEGGEAGHSVGKETPPQRGRKCRGWGGLGRLNPANGNQGMYRAKKRRAYTAIEGRIRETKTKKTEGLDHASAGKGCSTQGPSETEGDTCGGSDLQRAHPGCKREERVWKCRGCVGEGAATWI